MKRTVLAAVAISAAPLFADSVTSVDMQGVYNTANGPVAACSGSGPCNTSMTTPAFWTPYTGSVQFSAGFYGQTSFNLNGKDSYGLDGRTIPAGSYYLSANLGTWEGFDYNTPSQDLNPSLKMHAVFNMPVDSGDWTIQSFFNEYGDADSFESAKILYNGQTYSLNETCASYQSGQGMDCGGESATFTLQHTPGTMGQVEFDATSLVDVWGTDTVQFQAILTGSLPDSSPTPEPASAYLLLGGTLLIARKGFWRALNGEQGQ